MNKKPLMLLVDDSENDIFLMQRAVKKAELDYPIREVHNGEEAIAYLEGAGHYQDRGEYPIPSIMLLDLNMPKKDGFAVLSWVRAQPQFKGLAIIIMTASLRPEDVERAFQLGANSYLLKPSNANDLTSMIQILRSWTRINHFPPTNELVTR